MLALLLKGLIKRYMDDNRTVREIMLAFMEPDIDFIFRSMILLKIYLLPSLMHIIVFLRHMFNFQLKNLMVPT